jgi:hypothetical protein
MRWQRLQCHQAVCLIPHTHRQTDTHTTQTTQATRAFSSQVNEVFQNQPFSQKFEDVTTRRVVLVFQHQVLSFKVNLKCDGFVQANEEPTEEECYAEVL